MREAEEDSVTATTGYDETADEGQNDGDQAMEADSDSSSSVSSSDDDEDDADTDDAGADPDQDSHAYLAVDDEPTDSTDREVDREE